MSTTAIAADSNQSMFKPPWLQTAALTGGNGEMGDHHPSKRSPADHSLGNPIFAKNRYGREDMIALSVLVVSAPDGLNKCPYFTDIAQEPIVLTPLSEAESRLQQNINSSKAMSALSHTDRMTIASGGVIGGSNMGSQMKMNSESRTFSPSWAIGGGGGAGRGSGQSSRGGFANTGSRGRGTMLSSTGNSGVEATISGRYVPARGSRSGGISGRGNTSSTQPFNARAQALYDPRDPRDRPRQRLRSTSDEQNRPDDTGLQTGNSEWTQANRSSPWNKRAQGSGVLRQNNADLDANVMKATEWLNNDEHGESEGGISTNESSTFDDSRQFHSAVDTKLAAVDPLKKVTEVNDQNSVERQSLDSVTETCGLPKPYPLAVPWANAVPSDSNQVLSTKQFVVANFPSDTTVLHQSESSSINSAPNRLDHWYYVDPKNSVQGPFNVEQMQAWYKLGYFHPGLRVRHEKDAENSFSKLGDLIRLNSEEPFRVKSVSSPVVSLPLHHPDEMPLSQEIWGADYSASLMDAVKVKEERQKLEEEQRRMAEQERQLQEMHEALLKEELERSEREKRILEKEKQLVQMQEELARRAAEEAEKAERRAREIEEEKRRLAEELERRRREELEKKEEEERTRKLEQEAEHRRQVEEEQWKSRKEAEEALRRKMEAEKVAAGYEKETIARKSTAKEKEAGKERKAENKSPKGFELVEEFAPAMRQKAEQNTAARPFSWQATFRGSESKPIGPKIAPWVARTQSVSNEPSLLDIQQEEEQYLLAMKRKQQMELLKRKETVERVAPSVWNNASQSLAWSKPSPPSPTEDQRTAMRQMTSGTHDDTLFSHGSRDGKQSKSNKKVQGSSAGKLSQPEITRAKGMSASESQEGKDMFKSSLLNTDTKFNSWIVHRVKQLSNNVEADVFAMFLEGVEDPNEVEDYAFGYLGDGRQVKDFVREFLERRSQSRPKKVDKDDLTHPAVAADSINNSLIGGNSGTTSVQSSAGGGRKKKKGKGIKIVDGSCLGFKPAADPNRTNAGEIDTVDTSAPFGRR